MNKLVSFENFIGQKAAQAAAVVREEQEAKRSSSANSFKALLAEYGVAEVAELTEDQRTEFFAKLRGAEVNESTSLVTEGTRSQIGKIDKNGKIKSVYVHWEGYPEYMAPVIKKGYSNKKNLDQLLDLGKNGISILDVKIGDKQDFNNPTKGTSLFYGRDRDEEENRESTGDVAKIKKYLGDVANKAGAEYVYLYDERDGKWYMAATYEDSELKLMFESTRPALNLSELNEAIKVSSKREANKVWNVYTKIFNEATALTTNKETHIGAIREIFWRAMEDANFSREANAIMGLLKAPNRFKSFNVNVPELGNTAIQIGHSTINTYLDTVYGRISSAGKWGGITIVEGTALYLDSIGMAGTGQALIDDFNRQFNESVVTEAKFTKDKLLKLISKLDDAEITVKGKTYIIYNPDSNNDDNAAMWGANTINALNSDGDEFTFKYSDIEDFDGSIKLESKVNEAEIKSDEEFKEYAFTLLKKAFGEDFDEAKATEVVDGILGKTKGDYAKAAGMLQSSLG